jgi:hypothetical protein
MEGLHSGLEGRRVNLDTVDIERIFVRTDCKVEQLGNVSMRVTRLRRIVGKGCASLAIVARVVTPQSLIGSPAGQAKWRSLTKAFPESPFQLKVLPSNFATAQSEHSRANDLLEGSMAKVPNSALLLRSVAAMPGGIRTARAASARLVNTPSLLRDMMMVRRRMERRH